MTNPGLFCIKCKQGRSRWNDSVLTCLDCPTGQATVEANGACGVCAAGKAPDETHSYCPQCEYAGLDWLGIQTYFLGTKTNQASLKKA